MKAHVVSLLILDHDNLGAEEIKTVLEEQRYPNHCFSPRVIDCQTFETNWHDKHPLNSSKTNFKAWIQNHIGPLEEMVRWCEAHDIQSNQLDDLVYDGGGNDSHNNGGLTEQLEYLLSVNPVETVWNLLREVNND